MNRSLYYPLGRNADMDAGGAADLQTDIMRFMAILALCLVAIFALVQSLPLEAVTSAMPTESPTEPAVDESGEEAPLPKAPPPTEKGSDPFSPPRATQPDVKEVTWRDLVPKPASVYERAPNTSLQAPVSPAPPPESAVPERALPPLPPVSPPAPASFSPPEVQDSTTTSRAPTASANRPVPVEEVSEAPTDAPADEGFTLRFESDTALTRLVARNEIGLYAITDDKSLRMSVNRGTYSFWPASAPNQFHEMDPATVPADVITALRRAGSLGLDHAVKWGVTLPSKTQGQLNDYLSEYTGGSLVIEGDGNLRLEP